MRLSFKEVVELGFKEVTVQSWGYTEGRIFNTYQPFKTKRDITFKVVPLGENDAYLENKTFVLLENEDKLDYEWKGTKVYLDDPEIMAEIRY